MNLFYASYDLFGLYISMQVAISVTEDPQAIEYNFQR
jgi:hypothetical protein